MDVTRRELLRQAGLTAGALSVFGAGGCVVPVVAPSAVAGVEVGATGGSYTLPALPYGYDALEPHLDKKTLTLHHDKHHAGYVRGLNAALADLAKADAGGSVALAPALTKALAFHGSGHVYHSIYWASMRPGGGGRPTGGLGKMIDRDFGSYAAFAARFAAVTKKVAGSGWGVLAYEPLGGRLVLLGVEKHENVFFAGAAPIMVCDVWEHAYYLRYRNDRGAYVDAFLQHLVDWNGAARCLKAAMS